MPSLPRILTIAGSDSGGGAGIQADIKTITCLGGYAMTAITALTAQNTQGVFGIQPVPAACIAQQITLCLEDIGADAIKTGMLHHAEVIAMVADTIPPAIPLILDTVMVAKGGAPLLQPDAIDALRHLLIPKAHVITPNIPEAELLLGYPIPSIDAMADAAQALLGFGADAVLLKGGHLDGDLLVDVLASAGDIERFESTRIPTPHTHGTGCTLAAALATEIAKGSSLHHATKTARDYVRQAIQSAPGLGHGHGPLGHNFMI
jgi:hydroxymethylpyrimidine/phosphomethylpyrimidine kinase